MDSSTNLVYIHDGISSSVSSSFSISGTYCLALTFDGANLISCNYSAKEIYVHDGVTASILGTFNSPSNTVSGLALPLEEIE